MKHSPEFLRLVKSVKRRIREVSVEEVRKKFSHKASFHFIDVREDHEWEKGHAKGAIHIGRGILERDVEEAIPNKKAEIVLYCGGGFRSALSADSLQRMGYKNVFSMAGGFRTWKECGCPIRKSQPSLEGR